MKKTVLLASALTLFTGFSAKADLLTGVTATTDMGTWATYNIANLTNASGLSTPLSLTSTHDNNYHNMWMSGGPTTGTVTLDLGGECTVNTMAVWNYNLSGLLTRGVKTFSVDYSMDNATWTTVVSNVQLPEGNGTAALATGATIDMGGVDAQYVRIDIAANWGSSSYSGLSEVQFDGIAAPVPEPTTFALLGLGGAALLGLRRKYAKH